MVLAEFGTGQVLWSLIWFTLFFMWVWLVVSIFADVFRSHDLSGWGKAGWSIFVICLPFLGVLTYLIARGNKMNEHAIEERQAQEAMFREYVREAASTPTSGAADELSKLAALRDKGVIDQAEFDRMKDRVMAA